MKLTLNVGSGDRTFDEYPKGYKCINFDTRVDLKRVDEVGDVKDLSRFPDEHFSYILASDIIEHFPISETETILKEWRRVLKTGEIIEFRLPNLETICREYLRHKEAKYTSWLLYGGQDYSFNFHYVAFDREWFKKVVESIGFVEIEFIDEGNNMVVKFKKI